jgi:hypothetical protein
VAAKPVPNRCIWCLEEPSSATFKSESHVLPECVGNIGKQVLPQGIVCDKCNNFFGNDLEPEFINEPIFSTLTGILELRDIDSQFTYEHSPSGIHRAVHMSVKVSINRITLTTQYEIKGQPDKPEEIRTIAKYKEYNKRDLTFLSRAVHKMAFESIAHSLFVGTGSQTKDKRFENIDIFDSSFNVVRNWVRRGEPQHSVRPTLRIQKFNEVKTREGLFKWGGELWHFSEGFCYALNLFSELYILSITSSPSKVESDLKIWSRKIKSNNPVWIIGDKLQPIG